jgi:hypothetical protein
MTPTVRTTATVGDVLGTVHETWMEEVATFLVPALSEEADFWSRWGVVRFLGDQFGERFRLECALVEALDPLLPEGVSRKLAAARGEIERIVEELMIVGRRRATGPLTARLIRRFMDKLALWCVEVELATSGIEVDELSPEPSRLLTSLQAHALWA